MAENAHDESGPASPKPGDIALHQASRSEPSEMGKLRVFISYSRVDLPFADQLNAALNACGFECVIDRHGIRGGEDWRRRLSSLISEADTVVFVLTPSSARSEICDWEVEEAARLGKRILPVTCQPLEDARPPPRLEERHYIFFHEDPKAPGSGFGTGLASLIVGLNTDFDWLREHTRYLQRAIEWDRGGRPATRLLSGTDIAEAKAWAARRPKNAPEPIALHLDFIRASEGEAEARSSAQRKQLEAMAAAQAERETALNKAEDAQRKRARIRNTAFGVVSIFAVLAGWLYLSAEQQRKLAENQRVVAEEQRAAAEEQRRQADQILAGASNIIRKFYGEMDIDTSKEMFAVYQAGANHGNAYSMHFLGWLYYNGHGVTQDYGKAREWYEKAAQKGNASATESIGGLYSRGLGVTQDYTKAREWFEKGAGKGDANAMASLAWLYRNGHGVIQDYRKAREWYEQAAQKGNARAMAALGWLYDKGHGVTQDDAKAREWFEKAAENGNAGALSHLEDPPIEEAARAGRYDEALQMQEALLAKVEKMDAKRLDNDPMTAHELKGMAWYALFAREFNKALAASDRAHALLPDDLDVETNRAHALMFLGREKESEDLYLAHKGKPLPDQDGMLWERAIAEDFVEFRKAGLTHPMMAKIEDELGVSR